MAEKTAEEEALTLLGIMTSMSVSKKTIETSNKSSSTKSIKKLDISATSSSSMKTTNLATVMEIQNKAAAFRATSNTRSTETQTDVMYCKLRLDFWGMQAAPTPNRLTRNQCILQILTDAYDKNSKTFNYMIGKKLFVSTPISELLVSCI